MHIYLLPHDGVNEVTVISPELAVVRFAVEQLPDQRRNFVGHKTARDAFVTKMVELFDSFPERWLNKLGTKAEVTFVAVPPVHAGEHLELIDEAIRSIRGEERWRFCIYSTSFRKVSLP